MQPYWRILTSQARQLTESAGNWARQGELLLAFAGKVLDSMPSEEEKGSLEQGLSYFGKVSMIDPPREGVKKAIQDCYHAGIRPVMITGDHPATAKAIAEAVGIWKPGSLELTGTAFSQLSDADFAEQVERVSVYARVAPEQKLRIVQALQQKGHFTAMTGD